MDADSALQHLHAHVGGRRQRAWREGTHAQTEVSPIWLRHGCHYVSESPGYVTEKNDGTSQLALSFVWLSLRLPCGTGEPAFNPAGTVCNTIVGLWQVFI